MDITNTRTSASSTFETIVTYFSKLPRWQQGLIGTFTVWQLLELLGRLRSLGKKRIRRASFIKAICNLSSENGGPHGRVWLEGGPGKTTLIHGVIHGLTPGQHGFHIHQYGNLTQGCQSAGGHFNPHGSTHGGPQDAPHQRHIGDLGNIMADEKGTAAIKILDSQVKLFGPYSVVGRSMVCHAGVDDEGKGGNEESLKTGNAGARVCCGVIGLMYEGNVEDSNTSPTVV